MPKKTDLSASYGIEFIPAVVPTSELRAAAADTIRRLADEGKLEPVDGFEGGLAEGYLAVLGLDGKPIADSTWSKKVSSVRI